MTQFEPTVFVIDDDTAVRSSVCWLISAIDIPVQAFSSGQEFLESVDISRCGCAIVDVRMPGMSGLRLQQEIKERYPYLSTIIMSAYGTSENASNAVAAGALGFLEKPVDDVALIELVRKGIREARNSRQPGLPL